MYKLGLKKMADDVGAGIHFTKALRFIFKALDTIANYSKKLFA